MFTDAEAREAGDRRAWKRYRALPLADRRRLFLRMLALAQADGEARTRADLLRLPRFIRSIYLRLVLENVGAPPPPVAVLLPDLRRWLRTAPPDGFTLAECLAAVWLPDAGMREKREIGAVLRALGFEKKRTRRADGLAMLWTRASRGR